MTQAFGGLARISNVVGNEQAALATIVSQGAGLTSVLSQRSHQLFDLFGQANLVLTVLEQRRTAIQQLLTATSTLSQQLSSILTDVYKRQIPSTASSARAAASALERALASAPTPVMAASAQTQAISRIVTAMSGERPGSPAVSKMCIRDR